MKIRTDFVTNSSSSSFICVAKIDKSDKLLDYFKEEYGKYGLRLLDKYLVTGAEIKSNDEDYDSFLEFCEDEDIEISDTDTYLQVAFIEWSTDGDTDGDDAWLYNHIPIQFKEELYNNAE